MGVPEGHAEVSESDWLYGRVWQGQATFHYPCDWKLASILDVARLESGHTPSRKNPEYWAGNIPWVSLHDSRRLDGETIETTSQTISAAGIANSSARLLPAGTVVFSRTATVGKCTILGREMATSQDFANYICGPELHNRYLMQLLRFLKPEWNRLMAGSTHNTVYMPIFRDLKLLLPPLPEQRKIAAILSSVDDAIEKTQAVIDQVQVVKKGLMQELLTKGLPGRHQKFKQTEIGTIPESWEVRQLGELGTNGVPAVRTGPFGSALKTEHFTSSGTPILTIQSLGEGEVNSEGLFYVGSAKAHELRDYEVVPGDLVFSRVADIGRSIVVPEHASGWIISSNLMRISADRARVHSDYLMYSIVGGEPILSQLRPVTGGAGRPVVSATIVKGILVPLPPLQEQIDISSAIASSLEYSKTLGKQVVRLTELKSALMQSLLTGQLRVTP